jgi:hypothetical protein
MPTIAELFKAMGVEQAPIVKTSREGEYAEFVRIVRALVPLIRDDVSEKLVVSMIRGQIFHLPDILTGMVSVEALELDWNKRTKEHFYGRTESAKRLVREISQNPKRSDATLVAFVKSRCRVHQVTSKQNEDLKAYNKLNPNTHWRKAYAECGITLVLAVRKQKYVYTIDNVVYSNLQEVANKFNMSVEGVRRRFKSDKYITWIAKEV